MGVRYIHSNCKLPECESRVRLDHHALHGVNDVYDSGGVLGCKLVVDRQEHRCRQRTPDPTLLQALHVPSIRRGLILKHLLVDS